MRESKLLIRIALQHETDFNYHDFDSWGGKTGLMQTGVGTPWTLSTASRVRPRRFPFCGGAFAFLS